MNFKSPENATEKEHVTIKKYCTYIVYESP